MKKIIYIFLTIVLLYGNVVQAQENTKSTVVKSDNPNKVLLTEEKTKLLYQAQDYLSKIKTAKAKFVQINPDNLPISEGEFYISKPGRMMIKYVEPFNIYYFIEDESLIQYDYDLDQVTRANAPENPLRVLLYSDIKFYENNIMDVGGVLDNEDSFSVYLASKEEDYTEISGLVLTFEKNPVKLINIKRVDQGGNYTSMDIANLEINITLDEDVFSFVRPREKYPSLRK